MLGDGQLKRPAAQSHPRGGESGRVRKEAPRLVRKIQLSGTERGAVASAGTRQRTADLVAFDGEVRVPGLEDAWDVL
jgi:hypothetical protein